MKSENEKLSLLLRGAVIATLVTLSAVLRIAPHPWNLTPVGAMALFSGTMLRNRWIAFLLPLASLFAGDLFYGGRAVLLEHFGWRRAVRGNPFRWIRIGGKNASRVAIVAGWSGASELIGWAAGCGPVIQLPDHVR